MKRLNTFIKASFIGGVLVILPIAILVAAFNWLFKFVTNLIQPLTNFVIKTNGMPELLGDVLVISLIILSCFTIGSLVSTGAGRWLHAHFDKYLIKIAPGYRLIKEIIGQFFGDKSKSPFANGEVVKAQIFGSQCETAVTAIVTSKHDNGDFTVFVPTGPNPTSGNMYHLRSNQVEIIADAKIEEMMRTIIACGAGSADLFKK